MVAKFSKIIRIGLCLLAFAPFFGARASNIQISQVKIVGKDTLAGTAYVQFDLSWDFSFKDRLHYNWDAAWVFIKSYDDYNKVWKHLYPMATSGTPVAGGAGCFMSPPHSIGGANVPVWSEFGSSETTFGTKNAGVFIYRKEIGHGSNQITDIRIKWDYREDGYLNTDNLQVAVFAIEMVYIPAHDYIIGDGISNKALYADGKNIIIKTDVNDKRAKYMGTIRDERGFTYNGTPIPDTFPIGKKGFYIMKHEISQHAYVDFLNTLNPDQQSSRTVISNIYSVGKGTFALVPGAYLSNPGQYRNYIRVRSAALPETDEEPATAARFGHSLTASNNDEDWEMEDNGGNVACNFLSFYDGLAYLDWACLRPFTEMEFEKACRGTKFLRKEMAWGAQYGNPINNKFAKEPYFTNPFKSNERPKDTTTCYLETGKYPWVIRCGGFAFDSSRRDQSGATYYGVMNMSDNVWERCVNVSTAAGRAFIPKDGDGELSEQGEAEVSKSVFDPTSCWPDLNGFGFRGNQVSDRTYAESTKIYNNEQERNPYTGFRGARNAPAGTKFEVGN